MVSFAQPALFPPLISLAQARNRWFAIYFFGYRVSTRRDEGFALDDSGQ